MNGVGGLLDRYVLRRFVAAYGLCLLGLSMLFLVVDFMGHLADFLDAEKATKGGYEVWPLVAEYYVTKLPFILTFLGPYLPLFAAVAVLITFARHNELSPMIAAGRSHHRVLAPVYVFAALTAVVFVAVEQRVVPRSMKRNVAVEALLGGGDKGSSKSPPHVRDKTNGNKFWARKWLPMSSTPRLVDVHAPVYHDPTARLPEGKFDAEALVYARNRETGEIGWFPVEGTVTPTAAKRGGTLPRPVRLAPDKKIALAVTPKEIDLLLAAGDPGLTGDELAALVEAHPRRFDLLMQIYTRTTRPISSLVLLLLGLPFVMRTGQRTIASGLGIALGTCAVYVATDVFFQQIGNRGDMSPLVAAWVAPCFFGAIAVARLDRVAG